MQQSTIARPLDIWAQADTARHTIAFGVEPDRRAFSIRTRRLNRSVVRFITVWAFTLIVIVPSVAA